MDDSEKPQSESLGAETSVQVSSGPSGAQGKEETGEMLLNSTNAQKILEIIKNNPSAESTQNILNILKRHPVIIAQVIKERMRKAANEIGTAQNGAEGVEQHQRPRTDSGHQLQEGTLQTTQEQQQAFLRRRMTNLEIGATTEGGLMPNKNLSKITHSRIRQSLVPYPQRQHLSNAGGTENAAGVSFPKMPLAGQDEQTTAPGEGLPNTSLTNSPPAGSGSQEASGFNPNL